MTESTVLQPVSTQPKGPIAAQGWASTNWSDHDRPAVVLNPSATPLELLSFGVGQLEQVLELMSIISCSRCDVTVEPADIVGAFRHQIEPALVAIRDATDKLSRQEMTAKHG